MLMPLTFAGQTPDAAVGKGAELLSALFQPCCLLNPPPSTTGRLCPPGRLCEQKDRRIFPWQGRNSSGLVPGKGFVQERGLKMGPLLGINVLAWPWLPRGELCVLEKASRRLGGVPAGSWVLLPPQKSWGFPSEQPLRLPGETPVDFFCSKT